MREPGVFFSISGTIWQPTRHIKASTIFSIPPPLTKTSQPEPNTMKFLSLLLLALPAIVMATPIAEAEAEPEADLVK